MILNLYLESKDNIEHECGRRVSLTGKNKHEKQVQKQILIWTIKIDERHVPTKIHTRKCNGFPFAFLPGVLRNYGHLYSI